MEFLPPSNEVQLGDLAEHPFPATGKDVVIIGGGDTGADCLGTVCATVPHRCSSSRSCPNRPRRAPGATRGRPGRSFCEHRRRTKRHRGSRTRCSGVSHQYRSFEMDADGNLSALDTVRVEQQIVDGRPSFVPVEGTQQRFPAQMVLLAMGFVGPERSPLARTTRCRPHRSRECRSRRQLDDER